MYCIHYLWFNNLPSKLVMCHGQFWQVTNHISLVLEKKQNKTKNPDAIESLLKSYRTVLSNRMTSLWLTKFKVCSVSATDQVFLLGFLAQVQSGKKRKKVVKLTVWTKKMRLVRYLVYLLVQTKGGGREKLNSKNTFLVSYSKI